MRQISVARLGNIIRSSEFSVKNEIQLELHSSTFLVDVLNLKEIKILDYISSEQIDDFELKNISKEVYIKSMLSYFKEISNTNSHEKIFLVYQEVLLSNFDEVPYILFPIELDLDKMTFRMIANPTINPLLVDKFNLTIKKSKNFYDVDSVENLRKISSKGNKILQNTFITTFEVDSPKKNLETNFHNVIKNNFEKYLTSDDIYFDDTFTSFVAKELTSGNNQALLTSETNVPSILLSNLLTILALKKQKVLFLTDNPSDFLAKSKGTFLNNLIKVKDNSSFIDNLENNDFDIEKYNKLSLKLKNIENKLTDNSRKTNLIDAFNFVINCENDYTYHLKNSSSFDFDDIEKIVEIINNINELEEALGVDGIIQDSYLSYVKLDNIRSIEDYENQHNTHLEEAKLISEFLVKIEEKYGLNLSRNLSDLYSIVKTYKKFDLSLYPKTFLEIDYTYEALEVSYNYYNNILTRLNSSTSYIEYHFSKDIYNYDFYSCKKSITDTNVYQVNGEEFINKIAKKTVFNKNVLDTYSKGSKLLHKCLEDLNLLLGVKEISLRMLSDMLILLTKTNYYKRNVTTDYSDPILKKLFEEYLMFISVEKNSFVKHTELELKKYSLRFKRLVDKNAKTEYDNLKKYLKLVKSSKIDFNYLENMYHFFIEKKHVDYCNLSYGYNFVEKVLNIKEGTSKKVINLIKQTEKAYMNLFKLDFTTKEEDMFKFIKTNDLYKKECELIEKCLDDYNYKVIDNKVHDYSNLLKVENVLNHYKENLHKFNLVQDEIKNLFSIYYDDNSRTLKRILPLVKDFFIVKKQFLDFTKIKNVNAEEFYTDISELSKKLKRFLQRNEKIFNSFYLSRTNYYDLQSLILFLNRYNPEIVNTYKNYVEELSILADYNEYELMIDIKNKIVKNNLDQAIKRGFYIDLINECNIDNLSIDEFIDLNNLSDLNKKNEVYNFIQNKKLFSTKKVKLTRPIITLTTLNNVDFENSLLQFMDKFDVLVVNNIENYFIDDLDYLRKYSKKICVLGSKTTSLKINDSAVKYIEQLDTFYDIDDYIEKENNIENKETNILNYDISFDAILSEINHNETINVIVSSKEKRSILYNYLYFESLKNNLNYHDKIKIYTLNTYNSRYANKTILILDEKFNFKIRHNLINKIIQNSLYFDIYDAYSLITQEDIELIDSFIVENKTTYTDTEMSIIKNVDNDFEKGNKPVDLIFKGRKTVGVIILFDINYKIGESFFDLNKFKLENSKLDEICLINVFEYYKNKDKVIKELKEKING